MQNINTAHTKMRAGERGFTLVEMMVAVGLFAIVMVVCVGALLSLVNANRKAQALQSVINNLNIALDGIVRDARMGSDFYGGSATDPSCGSTQVSGMSPHDCASGGSVFAFEPFHDCSAQGVTCNNGTVPRWIYAFSKDSNGIGRIYRTEDGNLADAIPITAPEISIEDVEFYVVGTTRGDSQQPKVVIVVKGTAGAIGTAARTTFHIQATAVQRLLDL